MKALKSATPRGVLVGSPQLSAALQRLDLVDEYRFVVQPVVAGARSVLVSGLLRSPRQSSQLMAEASEPRLGPSTWRHNALELAHSVASVVPEDPWKPACLAGSGL